MIPYHLTFDGVDFEIDCSSEEMTKITISNANGTYWSGVVTNRDITDVDSLCAMISLPPNLVFDRERRFRAVEPLLAVILEHQRLRKEVQAMTRAKPQSREETPFGVANEDLTPDELGQMMIHGIKGSGVAKPPTKDYEGFEQDTDDSKAIRLWTIDIPSALLEMAWNTDAYRDLCTRFADRAIWAAIVPEGATLPEGIKIDDDMALIIPPEMPTVYVAFKLGPEKTHQNPKIKVIA